MDLPAYAGMFRIVGIVRDAKYTQPAGPVRPMFFLPLAQHAHYSEEVMRKSAGRIFTSLAVFCWLRETARGL